MRQSLLFSKTTKISPKDEKYENAILLIKGGFIEKISAGVYTFLPLGFKVLKKIEKIIREEMEKIDAQEILMPALHPKKNWQITGRLEKMDDLYRIEKREFILGSTHEEIIVPLAKKFIKSFRDLPVFLFQIQTKFRDEKRAKSGLLRGREFLMKDLYSFHSDKADLDSYYEKVKNSYFKVLERLELRKKTFLTYASGGTFSEFSHEFQTECLAGEDIIFICQKCGLAINKEIKGNFKNCPNCGGIYFSEKKAIEVANIFKLMTKFSEPFNLYFTDQKGRKKPVLMGCYGMGLGRLMAATVEIFHDKNGIFWPKEIAPFQVHLISLNETKKEAEKIYSSLQKEKIEVLYDDREKSAGEKFFDADLIGIPLRIVVSSKTISKKAVEIKNRKTGKIEILAIPKLIKFIKNFYD